MNLPIHEQPIRPTGIASAVSEGTVLLTLAYTDVAGDPDFDLFDVNGGLTADAQEFLGDIDSRGEFV